MQWVKAQHFEQPAQEDTLLDYLHEVEHAGERIERLEKSIDSSIEKMPEKMQAVIQGLQSLRGIARVSAVSIVAELGEISRFASARQLMGYSGAVSREHSTGDTVRRGPISKAGNAHLRRIVVEAAWAYRHRPSIGKALAARQKDLKDIREEVKEIAWKAQHRLHSRYSTLLAKGKTKQKVTMAVARELLGFIWAIGTHVEQTVAMSVPSRRAA
jgi:transposase